MSEKVRIIGKTTDGKSVVTGIFKFFDTTGIPLFVLFELCEQNNWLPSWIHFYEDGKKQGWEHKTIINRLQEGLSDCYGKEFSDQVIARLNKIYLGKDV